MTIEEAKYQVCKALRGKDKSIVELALKNYKKVRYQAQDECNNNAEFMSKIMQGENITEKLLV